MRIYLLLLTLLCSNITWSQKMASDYFDEGYNLVEQKSYVEAAKKFKYILDSHPGNKLVPKTMFNIAYCYYESNQINEALTIFKNILLKDIDDMERVGGRGIMASPYSNYKHNSASYLSTIYYTRKKYDSALYYFAIADSIYPYQHFCGNAMADNLVYTAKHYGDIYMAMGQKEKALQAMLPAIFVRLADRRELLELIKQNLSGEVGVVNELNNSILHIYKKTTTYEKRKIPGYYIRFRNTEIEIESNSFENEVTDLSSAAKAVKESDFYTMIVEL